MRSRTRESLCMGIGILAGLALSGPAAQATANLTATLSDQPIYVDGVRVELEAYAIHENNFVKLRDIGEAVCYSPKGHNVNRGVTRRYGYKERAENSSSPLLFCT